MPDDPSENVDKTHTERSERLPLTDIERRLLKRELEGLPEQLALAERLIDDLELHGLRWEAKSWQGARVERTRFVDCAFYNVDFSTAELVDARFERCAFVSCMFEDARLERCMFESTEITGGLFRRGHWLTCSFDACTLDDLTVEGTAVRNQRSQGGRIVDSRFSECELADVLLTEVEVASVRCTLCQGGPVRMQYCKSDDLLVLGGTYEEWTLSGGTANNVRFRALEDGVVRLDDLSSASWIHVKESTLRRLTIAHCPNVADLYVWQSRIELLTLSHGEFEGWVTECKLGAGAVRAATLLGFFWDETQANGLTFEEVTFRDAICARNARFVGMRLINPTYGPNLTLVLDGASFENSQRFLEAAP